MLKCLYCLCFAGKSNEQLNRLIQGEVVSALYDKDYNEARYKKSAHKLQMMQKNLETIDDILIKLKEKREKGDIEQSSKKSLIINNRYSGGK